MEHNNNNNNRDYELSQRNDQKDDEISRERNDEKVFASDKSDRDRGLGNSDVIALSSDDECGLNGPEVEQRPCRGIATLDLEDEFSQYFVNTSKTPSSSSPPSSSNTPELLESMANKKDVGQQQPLPAIGSCSSSSSSCSSSSLNSQYQAKKFGKIVIHLKKDYVEESVTPPNNSTTEVNEEAENHTKFKDFLIETLLNNKK